MEKKLRDMIYDLSAKFPDKESALLPALCYLQNAYGYVPEQGMNAIARILGLPEARVFSAASFYSMLNLAPEGKYVIRICANVVCTLLTPNPLLEYISNSLNINAGEVTPDGFFSIQEVECLGACGYAPAMQVNEEHYENLTFEKVDEVIGSIRKNEGQAQK